MKPMNAASGRTLTWLAAILLVAGGMVMSASGAFFLFVAAAVCAGFPALLGTGKMRVAASVLLLLSLVLAVSHFENFKNDQNRYRKHIKKSSRDLQESTVRLAA